MTSTGAIRIGDPARLGPALAEVRMLLGVSRYALAQQVAADTGRDPKTVENRVGQMERAEVSPLVRHLGPVLDVLGYDLALIPREEA